MHSDLPWRIPLIADDLPEAVEHAIVRIGAAARAGLQLSGRWSVEAYRYGLRVPAHTRVFTTSSGYLVRDEVSI